MFDLSGKIAIVTGAATGIGEVIAARLAVAGATVCIVDIDGAAAASAAERLGHGAQSISLDVTESASVTRAIESFVDRNKAVDILVNNAGLAGKAAPIWEQTDTDWHKVMEVNINGPFYLCRAAIPHMRSRGYGRIVNIASVAGSRRVIPIWSRTLGIEGRAHRTNEVDREGSCRRRDLRQRGFARCDSHQDPGATYARTGRLYGRAHSDEASRATRRGCCRRPLSS